MSIFDKIEEIRKKPEHIRMRYVWGGVAVVMFFIIIIWIFSLQETFKNSLPKNKEINSLKDQWQATKKEMPSISEFIENNQNQYQQDYTNNEDKINEINPLENQNQQ